MHFSLGDEASDIGQARKPATPHTRSTAVRPAATRVKSRFIEFEAADGALPNDLNFCCGSGELRTARTAGSSEPPADPHTYAYDFLHAGGGKRQAYAAAANSCWARAPRGCLVPQSKAVGFDRFGSRTVEVSGRGLP